MADDNPDRPFDREKLLQTELENTLMDECLRALHERLTNSNTSRNKAVRPVSLPQTSAALKTGGSSIQLTLRLQNVLYVLSGRNYDSRFPKMTVESSSTDSRFINQPYRRHFWLGNISALFQSLSREKVTVEDVREIKDGLKRRWDLGDSLVSMKKQAKIARFLSPMRPETTQESDIRLRHPSTGLWFIECDEF